MNAKKLKAKMQNLGADLIGIGDLSDTPPFTRQNLPTGIAVAKKYPEEVIRGIWNLPTALYRDWYVKLNTELDSLVTTCAEMLRKEGFTAIAQTREYVGTGEDSDNTLMPHKTVATHAGIGWIGKSALLITEKYGSMVRLSSVLTNAPLEWDKPTEYSKCGNCMICAQNCPGGAILGEAWDTGKALEEYFNAVLCRKTAQERSLKGFGGSDTICGKCIEVCPYTRKTWKKENR
ncbi:MAG: epoxyqueuosine reductase [Clostridiales bacterium]|jgi:epoxyqueuosine reductase QueG|nr:epoxyqueuosine reductase [Clostridiales bacterium]